MSDRCPRCAGAEKLPGGGPCETCAKPVTHVHIHRDAAGVLHVQHLGPEHVLPGSVREFFLEPGEAVVVRHVPCEAA